MRYVARTNDAALKEQHLEAGYLNALNEKLSVARRALLSPQSLARSSEETEMQQRP
jgi:hypothetical protein